MNRTNNCGELSKANINQNVKLSGWVNKVRKVAKVIPKITVQARGPQKITLSPPK